MLEVHGTFPVKEGLQLRVGIDRWPKPNGPRKVDIRLYSLNKETDSYTPTQHGARIPTEHGAAVIEALISAFNSLFNEGGEPPEVTV